MHAYAWRLKSNNNEWIHTYIPCLILKGKKVRCKDWNGNRSKEIMLFWWVEEVAFQNEPTNIRVSYNMLKEKYRK
jgi:hypothetical protein